MKIDVYEDIRDEVARARLKFPPLVLSAENTNRNFMALVEEVGELAEAILKFRGEGHTTTKEEVYREGIQVAAMAVRVITELRESIPINTYK